MRNGDFSGIDFGGVSPLLYEPTTLDPQMFDAETNSWYRTMLMGGDGLHVPANRVNPVSAAVLKLVPMPNRPADASCSWCGNYAGGQSTVQRSDGFAVRLDHGITEKQTIFGRFNRSNYDQEQTSWMGGVDPAPSTRMNGQWGMTLNYIYTMTPTTILDARVGGHYNPHQERHLHGRRLQQFATSPTIPSSGR